MDTIPEFESHSLWFKYKSAMWTENKEQKETVSNTLKVFRALRNIDRLAYASMPASSGKYLYEQLLKYPNISKEVLMKGIIGYNYFEGLEFVKRLESKIITCPIIFPMALSDFYPNWKQEHYQSLWLGLIAEKCTEMYMMNGWEYSNGATEELTHAFQLQLGIPKWRGKDILELEYPVSDRARMRGIEVYEHNGMEITIAYAVSLLESAISDLESKGFTPKTLIECKYLLEWTQQKIDEKFYQ